VLTPGIRNITKNEGGALVLDLSLLENMHTPERVEIEVFWHQTSARLASITLAGQDNCRWLLRTK